MRLPPFESIAARRLQGSLPGFGLLSLVCLTALLVGGCSGSPPPESGDEGLRERLNQLVVEDASVAITSGTAALRTVRATHAVFHEDTRYLEATSVTLSLRLPQQNRGVTVHAIRGEVFLAAAKSSQPVAQVKSAAKAELKAGAKAGIKSLARSGAKTASNPGKKTGAQSGGKSDAFEFFKHVGAVSSPVGLEGMRKLAALPMGEHAFGDVILHGPVKGRSSDGGTFETQTVLWSEQMKRLMVPTPYHQAGYSSDGGRLEMSGSGFEVDSSLQHWAFYGDNEPLVGNYQPAEGKQKVSPMPDGTNQPGKEGRSPNR